MACGNNHVSRGYLSSQPTSTAQTSANFFSARANNREIAPVSKHWAQPDGQMYYSRSQPDKTDYFVGPDGNQTFKPDRHVHVIHDESKHEVVLVLTDRTHGGNPHVGVPITLNNPSGNEVNKAIERLVAELNARPRGSVEVPL